MRLFVALDLPWPLRETLGGLLNSLSGARWVPPENHHLTLRFVGEVPPYVADEVDAALAAVKVRPFTLALSGVGVFDRNGRPSALWAGVARSEQLDHLQNKIETALRRIGLPGEKRRFQPHISLARVDGVSEAALARWVQGHNLLRSDAVPVTSFTLFSSQLGKEQPVYTAEVDYELA
ncbi:RNA 2',3'-cyclic phosphodiesterase [Rhizosaccharibacter radicis]|uniref:RNA 2',3'-cyclic phosphodiesterase n=1 Tax=Rhizosaccharibacter radicis TaxID=2782605 RepID=A0ABT1VVT6_9PROT|nr:RNA 2',3'-cyclic phosphodiesterase [Acetobacteraceae bacterium KSS12]